MAIIDPAPAVARQVGRVLTGDDLNAPPDGDNEVRYYTTLDPDRLSETIRMLTGQPPGGGTDPLVRA